MNNVPIWLPRVAGIVASLMTGYAAKHELNLDPEWITGAMLATYAFLHRAISAHTNPGDSAKRELIPVDRAKVAAVKASEL